MTEPMWNRDARAWEFRWPMAYSHDRAGLSGDTAAFAALGDDLVREIFGIGLRLQEVRAIFDGEQVGVEELRAARSAMVELLDCLDRMIRETGVSMLALTSARPPMELWSRRANGH
ncbi:MULTISPECIES: hypothetical protein [unclassified Nocardia]|uniref:hypothetical protein n=1 Tax=unclassified Nocardia TaxID=2637762 RepID=UPI001CE43C1F|nr:MULTISPECIES: hypothetical protein [unclassified Nocardia]